MSNNQHCINCLLESKGLYQYPCKSCNWSPEDHSTSGLYLSPGTILHGQYQIAKMLGHGGFGITYLAWDNLLEIKLAIKEYMPRDFATRNSTNSEISTFAGDAQANFAYGLERFLDEARTLAKFQQHNGIVSVLNVFYGNGTGYMVMEYVDGLTLKEYLVANDKLSWEQTLKLFMPVMDALREVHKYGMLHRDISPDNIYLCQDNRIKLLDFGSARYALGGHSRSLSVVVKPGYAPEEQYRTKGKQGTWTDVYSVAASMYRCITGLVPPDALDRLDEDELVKPSNLGVNISAQAELELMSALAIKAENRTQTIKSFQQGLLIQVDAEAMDAKPQFKKDNVTVAPKNQANEGTSFGKGPIFYRPAGEFKNQSSGRKETKLGSWFSFLCLVFIFGYFNFFYQSSSTKEPVNNEQTLVSSEQLSSNSIGQQDIATQIKNGDKYYDAKDYIQAAIWYQKAADQGYKYAQYHLGHMYAEGQGVTQDYIQAVNWYQKAANQDIPSAQVSLGWYYMNGFGNLSKETTDYKKAIYWNKKGAKNGDPEGFNNLGWLYENGLGIQQNLNKAAEFYQNAITEGIKEGVKKERLQEAQSRLANIKTKIHTITELNEPSDVSAQVELASKLYAEKNYNLAANWYRKAADQGDAYGQSKLGTLYAKGQGVKKNPKEAIKLYLLSANQGFVEAQNNLGVMYFNGIGVSKNQEQALKWFKLAAEQGDKKSIKVLEEITASNKSGLDSEPVTNSEQSLAVIHAKQAIQQKVTRSWIRPVSVEVGLMSKIRVKLMSDGTVIDAEAISSSGNEVFDRSAENAVKKASPLPVPKDKRLFAQEFRTFDFMFNPDQISEVNTKNTTITWKIGDKLADGVVFYVDTSGEHGLVARPTDSSSGATAEDAVKLVNTLGTGWRLPTKQELDSLYSQKTVVGGFVDSFYWSSSGSGSGFAWFQYFGSGVQDHGSEYSTHRVRAVRAF